MSPLDRDGRDFELALSHLLGGVGAQVGGLLAAAVQPVPRLLAEVDAAGELADDEEVDTGQEVRTERRRAHQPRRQFAPVGAEEQHGGRRLHAPGLDHRAVRAADHLVEFEDLLLGDLLRPTGALTQRPPTHQNGGGEGLLVVGAAGLHEAVVRRRATLAFLVVALVVLPLLVYLIKPNFVKRKDLFVGEGVDFISRLDRRSDDLRQNPATTQAGPGQVPELDRLIHERMRLGIVSA